jgi:hypothetical protein
VALAFAITTILFMTYERMVTRRENTKNAALKAISEMFPSAVQNKVLEGYDRNRSGGNSQSTHIASFFPATTILFGESTRKLKLARNFLGVSYMLNILNHISDFSCSLSNNSIPKADIEGFTAWASTREPAQVFHLLETIYGAFDEIARSRGVFKVETVGDCYVAVVGMPDPRPDHAVTMVRFAKECQLRMASMSQQLEISLGPDTADLAFR